MNQNCPNCQKGKLCKLFYYRDSLTRVETDILICPVCGNLCIVNARGVETKIAITRQLTLEGAAVV